MTASLYVHIPFCRKKCPYCDFYKTIHQASQQTPYCNALTIEASHYKPLNIHVDTLFFGGGTPSLLTQKNLATIKQTLFSSFNIDPHVEWTIEINPEDITHDLLSFYESLGINRLSVGIQSFNQEELLFLGRQHTPTIIYNALETIKHHTKKWNINIDLIFGSQTATLKSLKHSLTECLKYTPNHISTYALTIEKNTPFGKQNIQTLGSEKERTHFEWIINTLKKHHYLHYEISAFCKKGKECQHNLAYWTFKDYIGLGPSGSSFLKNKRTTNTASYTAYLKNPSPLLLSSCTPKVHSKNLKIEYILSNLRRIDGFFIKHYNTLFQTDFNKTYHPAIKKLQKQKLIESTEKTLKLTKKGVFFLNEVLLEFI